MERNNGIFICSGSTSIGTRKRLDVLFKKMEQQSAHIDYITMMSDIEFETDEGEGEEDDEQ